MKTRRLAAPLAAVLALLLSAQAVLATTWLPVTYVGGAMGGPGAMAMAGTNTVGVAYTDITSDFISHVYFRRSIDGGANWQTSIPMSPATLSARDAALSGRGSVFDLVWSQQDPGGGYRTWYSRSLDAGVSWHGTKSIATTTGVELAPRVARDDAGRVVVVWLDEASVCCAKVFVRVSTDGGVTFGTRHTLDSTGNPGSYPNVAIGQNGKIHVAYIDGDQIKYRRSSDNGATWTTPLPLVTGSNSDMAPAMAAGGTNLLVGYTSAAGSGHVAYRRSIDNGTHWQAEVALATDGSGKDTFKLILSARSGTWRALYNRCQTVDPCMGATPALVMRSSIDGGDTWSATEAVPTAGFDYAIPAGITGGAKTVVAWMRDNGSRYVGVYARRAQ